ncbi:Mut7-C RNAse domain-containing protein [Egicoccus sp. AB-alg6-2]|uniref:Mut7-C RNAse domain-containing protein n=1 Tax=Egicoccus sp. AB-alg6-2 TaxID=3242692 RepID=UPI00359CDB0B
MHVGRVVVRCYATLLALAGEPEQQVPIGSTRSVKDVVESIGVPHVEVGLLVVDGVAVGFDHLLHGGERVAVYPPFTALPPAGGLDLFPEPPDPRRFVLDVHLGTLARRLRWLGFDTWWSNDADDDELAVVAVTQRRILLSRDRGLLMRRAVVHGYCPRSDDPELQLLEVAERYRLAPRLAPGTRCIRCNGALVEVTKGAVADRLPPRVREGQDEFRRCEDCDQVYWPGTHHDPLQRVTCRAQGRRPTDGFPPAPR